MCRNVDQHNSNTAAFSNNTMQKKNCRMLLGNIWKHYAIKRDCGVYAELVYPKTIFTYYTLFGYKCHHKCFFLHDANKVVPTFNCFETITKSSISLD